MLLKILGLFLFTIFLLLSLIHVYWGIGGKWGASATIPTSKENTALFKPGIAACFIVAIGLVVFGLIVLEDIGLVNLYTPKWISQYRVWIIALIFLLRAIGDFKYVGFTRSLTNTQFAKLDRLYYTPFCLLLATLLVLLKIME